MIINLSKFIIKNRKGIAIQKLLLYLFLLAAGIVILYIVGKWALGIDSIGEELIN